MFQDTDYEITEDEKIAVFALEYLTSISDLTSVTSKRLVSNNYVINQWILEITLTFMIFSRYRLWVNYRPFIPLLET